jgi:ankyrin repeat protein
METLDTALMDAVLDGDEELVYSLLESGVPANGRNSHGKTLLSLGLENGAPDATLKELIRHGADVNTKDEKGITPLMIAASTPSCSPSMIRYLLRAGADPTIKNADGEDARIVAAKVGSPEVISCSVTKLRAKRPTNGERRCCSGLPRPTRSPTPSPA